MKETRNELCDCAQNIFYDNFDKIDSNFYV